MPDINYNNDGTITIVGGGERNTNPSGGGYSDIAYVIFLIVTVVASFFIGGYIYRNLGADLFVEYERTEGVFELSHNIVCGLAPFIIRFGAMFASFIVGLPVGEELNFNIFAYIAAFLSAALGGLLSIAGVYLMSFALGLIIALIGFGLLIGIIAAIFGG